MRPRDYPVRFTHLKKMSQSPAHYLASLTSEFPDSIQLRIGRLVHCMLLGGAYQVYDGERRGKAWQMFSEAHRGQDIVTEKEHARAKLIADSVRRHPEAMRCLEGKHEGKIIWENSGRTCSSTLDVVNPGASFLCDLKTAQFSEPGRFMRSALGMGYHAQLAWYQDAYEHYSGVKLDHAHIVAVETKAPYPVTVFELTPRALEEGRKLCRGWLERLLVCEEADVWPGYCESVISLDVVDDVEFIFGDDEVAA